MPEFTTIRKRDSTLAPFDPERIRSVIAKASECSEQLEAKEISMLVDEVLKRLSEKVNRRKDSIPTVEDVQDAIEEMLIKYEHTKVAKHFILYRHERQRIREEKEGLIGSIPDKRLSLNALKILRERYLLKDDAGTVTETSTELFHRVARAIAKADLLYDKKADLQKTEETFFKMLYDMEFLPNSPTLMNAGTKTQQLAGCFVLPLPDSIDGIFETLGNAAHIYKTGAGAGFSFSSIRPKHALITTSKGAASGPVSFLKIFDVTTEVMKQGGKKRGANIGILRVDHPDIIDFIRCKDFDEHIRNFNISVALTEEFMEAFKNNKNYSLINPTTGKPSGEQSARYVFDILSTAAWDNGDPGVIFLDRMQQDNPTPHEGPIAACSPCGEAPLLSYEACHLGSINLGSFAVNKRIDWKRLKEVVHTAVHFLDNAVDSTVYPSKDIETKTKKNRKIGLGVMGFADMLVKLRIPYNSEKGVAVAEKVMKFIQTEADIASETLAQKRETFPNWEQSIYCKTSPHFKGIQRLLRNATRTCISPTGSISMIADASPSIEPIFALSYVRQVFGNREFFYVDKNFEDALDEAKLHKDMILQLVLNQGSIQHIKEIPKQLRKVFVVTHDVEAEWHIKMQAAFQKYCDNAVSKTVNLPSNSTIKDVQQVYLDAYKLGCKGITIYRDKSKTSQIFNLT